MKSLFIKNIVLLSSFLALGFLSSCEDDESTETPFIQGTTHIALEGEDNMRDLGGIVGCNTKKIIFGKLYRSGELSNLSTNDVTKLSNLGLVNLIDLRTDSEISKDPDNVPSNLGKFHLPLLISTGTENSEQEFISNILSGKINAKEFMLKIYSEIDSIKIANWKTIFNILEEGKPTLWHCTAGKDRAGLTTALVLSSLCVNEQTIYDNFLESNVYLKPYIDQQIEYVNSHVAQGAGELLRPVFGVELEYIQTFYQTIKTNYGSVDNFLTILEVDKEKMRKNYLHNY